MASSSVLTPDPVVLQHKRPDIDLFIVEEGWYVTVTAGLLILGSMTLIFIYLFVKRQKFYFWRDNEEIGPKLDEKSPELDVDK